MKKIWQSVEEFIRDLLLMDDEHFQSRKLDIWIYLESITDKWDNERILLLLERIEHYSEGYLENLESCYHDTVHPLDMTVFPADITLDGYNKVIEILNSKVESKAQQLSPHRDGKHHKAEDILTDEVKRWFNELCEIGLLEKTDEGYSCASNALLAFIAGVIWCGDRVMKNVNGEPEVKHGKKGKLPQKDLKKIFGVSNLSQSRYQLDKNSPPDRYEDVLRIIEG